MELRYVRPKEKDALLTDGLRQTTCSPSPGWVFGVWQDLFQQSFGQAREEAVRGFAGEFFVNLALARRMLTGKIPSKIEEDGALIFTIDASIDYRPDVVPEGRFPGTRPRDAIWNYATWVVVQWIDHDMQKRSYWLGEARRHREEAPGREEVEAGVWTVEETALFCLTDQMREEIWKGAMLDDLPPLYASLLAMALSSVEWIDVAAHVLGA